MVLSNRSCDSGFRADDAGQQKVRAEEQEAFNFLMADLSAGPDNKIPLTRAEANATGAPDSIESITEWLESGPGLGGRPSPFFFIYNLSGGRDPNPGGLAGLGQKVQEIGQAAVQPFKDIPKTVRGIDLARRGISGIIQGNKQ